MFRTAAYGSVMVIAGVEATGDDSATLPLLSLDARLGLLRRRRRLAHFRQGVALGPLLVGTSLLILAAIGGIASFR